MTIHPHAAIPGVGDPAPPFQLTDQEERLISLEMFSGKWLILYFYPKDNTPGCTLEATDFSCLKSDFEKMNAEVVGVSGDSAKTHRHFIAVKELTLTLLSDPEHITIQHYGAWRLKKNYGKEYYGVQRSTFLIDPNGKIAYAWPNVQAKGHALAVKEKLKELQ